MADAPADMNVAAAQLQDLIRKIIAWRSKLQEGQRGKNPVWSREQIEQFDMLSDVLVQFENAFATVGTVVWADDVKVQSGWRLPTMTTKLR